MSRWYLNSVRSSEPLQAIYTLNGKNLSAWLIRLLHKEEADKAKADKKILNIHKSIKCLKAQTHNNQRLLKGWKPWSFNATWFCRLKTPPSPRKMLKWWKDEESKQSLRNKKDEEDVMKLMRVIDVTPWIVCRGWKRSQRLVHSIN